MNSAAAALLGLVVAVLVLFVGAFARWRYAGWNQFRHQAVSPYVEPTACTENPNGKGGSVCPDAALPCVAGACYPSTAPKWAVPGKDASMLRFRNAVFTVRPKTGAARSRDVTANLNAMAAAFAPGQGPAGLTLVRPLNALSFTIPDFNTTEALARDGARDALLNAAVTLTGEYRAI